MFCSFFHFLHFNVPEAPSTEVACVIFYTHQTNYMCAGKCECDCMHEIDELNFLH